MELALEVLLAPFVACLVLTGVHTYLGLHVVSRGVIFVDLALAQIAALGATFAFLLGFDPASTTGYFYSLLFTVIGAAIFSISRLKDQRIPQEAIIGITFAVASATVILMADRAPQGAEHVEAMLTGALLWVSWPTILKTAAIYSVIGVFHWVFRRRFLTVSLAPEEAAAKGWSVRWWDFLFYTSFGWVITSSVAMAGVLLVFSFLVIPSVIAMLFARRVGARLAVGWTVGTVVSVIGLWLSYTEDFPSGPAVVCTFGCALILAGVVRYLMVAESRGWALAKVAATAGVVVLGIWMAFSTAAVVPGEHGAEVDREAVAARTSDPVEVAKQAFAALEQSPDAPPADAVADLLSVNVELHRMMITGQVTVSESAVQALARFAHDKAAGAGDPDLGHVLEEIAYHAADPWARLRGAQALVDGRSELGLEALIELLEHDTPVLVKLQAVDLLKQATGQGYGLDVAGDEEAKKLTAQKWREWWTSHREHPWQEPTLPEEGQP